MSNLGENKDNSDEGLSGEHSPFGFCGHKAFDGSTCLSFTALGLRGKMPHFFNPLIMFRGVNDCGSASATSPKYLG